MTQLARRASLVVVLLLASVATASAECAWVLSSEVPEFFIRLDERKVTIQRQNVFFLIYRYAYLPDTVDPRGQKGK